MTSKKWYLILALHFYSLNAFAQRECGPKYDAISESILESPRSTKLIKRFTGEGGYEGINRYLRSGFFGKSFNVLLHGVNPL